MKTPTLPPTSHQPQKYSGPSADEVLALRKQFMNPGIFLDYKKPLMVVEGSMQYVWDETGKLGNHIHAGLNKLKAKHQIIGDVRGKGLMIGIEMVKNRATYAPASVECAQVLGKARELGLLIGKGGWWGQTIRFAPPMCITQPDADFLPEVLDESCSTL